MIEELLMDEGFRHWTFWLVLGIVTIVTLPRFSTVVKSKNSEEPN